MPHSPNAYPQHTARHFFARTKQLLILLGVSLYLGGCSLTPTKQPNLQSKDELYTLDSWRASGKLGTRYKGKNESAFFSWTQTGDDYTIHLYGPLGQGSVYLYKEGNSFRIESKDLNEHAASPEQLLQRTTGLQLPVSNLAYWLRGIPATSISADKTQHNEDGDLSALQQEGWEITYRSYMPAYGLNMPEKIIAKRKDIKLTVSIKSWDI
ncbi:lipoprotein insertase outer membrane protein LolB [Saccharophagus degradans]|uniref:Outer-membrane lipoprotein LolB n=1 Tax=Saccharophagus degradans (strain 2-40 / ATCC 43961 / DSM 17024) TaxID=203122 RepID=Q21FM0_SACD2|nr:lipoprotein insertase outer membrane protein LolB [Saccharophagus degradans]ABD82509.1 transcriptional regulator, GntR family [Saccharophagus degradans 2-40]